MPHMGGEAEADTPDHPGKRCCCAARGSSQATRSFRPSFGRLQILDDCSAAVSGFTYDGKAPAAYWCACRCSRPHLDREPAPAQPAAGSAEGAWLPGSTEWRPRPGCHALLRLPADLNRWGAPSTANADIRRHGRRIAQMRVDRAYRGEDVRLSCPLWNRLCYAPVQQGLARAGACHGWPGRRSAESTAAGRACKRSWRCLRLLPAAATCRCCVQPAATSQLHSAANGGALPAGRCRRRSHLSWIRACLGTTSRSCCCGARTLLQTLGTWS